MWLLAKQATAGDLNVEAGDDSAPRRVVGTRQRRVAGTCASLTSGFCGDAALQ